jgi:hypothetical protein
MMRRAIALVLSCAALSGCGAIPSMPGFNLPSVKMPSFSGLSAPITPVHVISVPPGAEASFQGQLHHALHAGRAEWHRDLHCELQT